MKLSDRLWDEWLSSLVTDRISARSELAGLVASMDLSYDGTQIKLSTDRFWVFRRVRRLWPKTCWGAGRPVGALLRLKGGKVALAMPSDVFTRICTVPEDDEFIALAWLRGVWGVCGSLYVPKSGYYCLMRIRPPLVLSRAAALLTTLGFNFATRMKAGAGELILRDLETITRLCYYLKLPETEGALQERSMARMMRDLANRQANCDDANIRRSVAAAREQDRWARFAKNRLTLPPLLEQLVDVRLSHPDATLGELGTLLLPPMSKSTVKYRWNKVLSLARQAGYEDGSEGPER